MANRTRDVPKAKAVIVDMVMLPGKRRTAKKMRALQKYIDDYYHRS